MDLTSDRIGKASRLSAFESRQQVTDMSGRSQNYTKSPAGIGASDQA
jgi:hypothetical protein